MTQKIAIQTDTKPGYVTESLDHPRTGAYHYCGELKDAILFSTVNEAVRWIERTSFYSGERGSSFSGSPKLVPSDGVAAGRRSPAVDILAAALSSS